MNPINFIQNYMLKGMTPKGIVKQLAGNNPILGNLINMAEKGEIDKIKQFAINYCNSNNINFDEELNKFMSNFK